MYKDKCLGKYATKSFAVKPVYIYHPRDPKSVSVVDGLFMI